MILTDANGRPLIRPEAPSPDAPPQAFTAWLRADNAYRDAVAALANRAFTKQLTRSLKGSK